MPAPTNPESITVSITSEIADKEGVDPIELEPPLQHAVEMDALTTLVEEAPNEGLRVVFRYQNHEVLVTGGGRVEVNQLT